MEDVYYSGTLYFKTGTFSTPLCLAQLKFESRLGPKRLELFQRRSNEHSMEVPLETIPLTHVLAVSTNKQAATIRGRHMFQILTTARKYQLGASSLEEKVEWMEKIKTMWKNVPVGERTHEFNVEVRPTSHSDRLRLHGEYVLKVTTDELRLFSSNGALDTLFRSPLDKVEKAHSCMLAPTGRAHGRPSGAALYGNRDNAIESLLIISTARSSPVKNGGFVFATQSAADIVNIINHRIAQLVTSTENTQVSQDIKGAPSLPPRPHLLPTPPHPDTSSSREAGIQEEKEVNKTTPAGVEGFKGSGGAGGSGTTEMLNCKFDRVSKSLYSPQPRCRPITPLIINRRNGKCLFLDTLLTETQRDCEVAVTPDEPRYVNSSELHEVRQKLAEPREGGSNKAVVEEAAPATSPDYYNGEFIKATALLAKRGRSAHKVRKMARRERSVEEKRIHSVKILERQHSIDLLSSGEQETATIKSRPRANAFCEIKKAPCPLPRKQTAPLLVLRDSRLHLGSDVSMSDTEDATHFESSALSETRHISSSDPTLKYPTTSSHAYLTILYSVPVLSGKQTKRPVPTPRTLPPHQHPTTTPTQPTEILPQPLHPTMRALPPLPAAEEGGGEKSDRLRRSDGVGSFLHCHQRSISEVNLHSRTFSINAALYVNMQDLHDRHDEQLTPYASVDEVESYRLPVNSLQLPQRGLRSFDRQKSSSMGDIYAQCNWGVPSNELNKDIESLGDNFSCTEQIYENGQLFMYNWMYNTEGTAQQQQPLYCNWDSGIGSTPNSSPFENTKTFSTGETEWYSSRGRGEEKASKEATPMLCLSLPVHQPHPKHRPCMFQLSDRISPPREGTGGTRPCDPERVYENVPFVAC